MSDITSEDKAMITKIMGETFGNEFGKIITMMKTQIEENKRLQDQRYENTVERLTRIEFKLDELKK